MSLRYSGTDNTYGMTMMFLHLIVILFSIIQSKLFTWNLLTKKTFTPYNSTVIKRFFIRKGDHVNDLHNHF